MFRRFGQLLALAILLLGQQAQAQSKRPIVAISQIEDQAGSGQAQAFSTMIETAIAATTKFRVIERSRLGNLVREQAMGKSGLVTSRNGGKMGGFEGADFLIYGTITSLSVVNKADLGSALIAGMLSNNATGQRCTSGKATLSVDIRITDADSGEVRYVRRINEEQKLATVCGGGNAQIDAAQLLRSAADKIATGLVTTVYPIQIAAVQSDGVIVLNYGEGAVVAGDILSVFIKGEVIRDPATGEVLANNEERIGAIRITDVLGRVSKAQAVTSFGSSPPIGSIVRPATDEELAAMRNSGKRKGRN